MCVLPYCREDIRAAGDGDGRWWWVLLRVLLQVSSSGCCYGCCYGCLLAGVAKGVATDVAKGVATGMSVLAREIDSEASEGTIGGSETIL